MSIAIYILLNVLVIAYAALCGVFLAFSDFIMRALYQVSGGAEAMQVINRTVFRWLFMALFIGLVPVSIGLAVYGWGMLGGGQGHLMALAGLCYLLGCFGVTAARNVPLNEALAGMVTAAPETQEFWHDTYVPRWTFWNTLRAFACGLSAALVLASLGWQNAAF